MTEGCYKLWWLRRQPLDLVCENLCADVRRERFQFGNWNASMEWKFSHPWETYGFFANRWGNYNFIVIFNLGNNNRKFWILVYFATTDVTADCERSSFDCNMVSFKTEVACCQNKNCVDSTHSPILALCHSANSGGNNLQRTVLGIFLCSSDTTV